MLVGIEGMGGGGGKNVWASAALLAWLDVAKRGRPSGWKDVRGGMSAQA